MIKQLLLTSLIFGSIPALGFSAAASAATDVKTRAADASAAYRPDNSERDNKHTHNRNASAVVSLDAEEDARTNATASASANVKTQAADTSSRAAADAAVQGVCERDSRQATAEHYDGELDTAGPRYTYEPPSDDALKQSYEKASKQVNQLDVLVELCKPYAKCDPDRFAWEVFERWKKLCEDLGLLVNGLFNIRDDFLSNIQRYIDLLAPVGSCCLSLAEGYNCFEKDERPDWNRRLDNVSIRRLQMRNFLQAYQFRPPNHYKQRHAVFKEKETRYPQAIRRSTPLLGSLAIIVGEYANEFGYSLKEALQVRDVHDGDGYYNLLSLGINNLIGLSALNIKQSHIWLTHNLIASFAAEDLPANCVSLRLNYNRLYETPQAFEVPSRLQKLDLSGNFISKLSKSSLAGLVVLESLDINDNNISFIEAGALTQLPCLEKLGLGRNSLRTVPADIEILVRCGQIKWINTVVQGLDLYGNPLCQNPAEMAKLAELMAKVEQNKKYEGSGCSVQ